MTSTLQKPQWLMSTTIDNADGNNFTETGIYQIGSISSNMPAGYGILLVMAPNPTSMIFQEFFRPDILYVRRCTNGNWGEWKLTALT